MIDPRDVSSCRTVEDATSPEGTVLGTKVGDRMFSADRDTLFPLQAALGYDVTRSLFIGDHPLMVDGPSDLLYLQWASDRLRAEGRKGLDPRWTGTPCGGLARVPSFLALFGRDDIQMAILVGNGGGKEGVNGLEKSDSLQRCDTLTLASYAESGSGEAGLEGLLGADAHGELLRLSDSVSAARAVPDDDRFSAARYLIEHPSALGEATGPVLDRFERLFGDLNGLL